MDKKNRSIIFVLAILTLTFYLPNPAHSTEVTNYTFTKIADFQTGIPAGTGNFNALGNPSISEGKVAFYGESVGLRGIYLYDDLKNQLEVVADSNTEAPGGYGNFLHLGDPSISSGNIAFYGFSRQGIWGEQGIFTYIGGALEVLADADTEFPDGSGNFAAFGRDPSISGDKALFRAVASFQGGVYTNYGGPLSIVADGNTPIPGGSGEFASFWHTAMSNGNMVFLGSRIGQEGIYFYNYDEDLLEVVADLNTEAPGGNGNFIGFEDYAISGDRVAFFGVGSSGPGIFLYNNNGGQIEVVADRNTPIPGRAENFSGFSYSPSISGNKVAFKGMGSGFQGIYLFSNSSIEKVIARDDILDGRRVVSVELGSEGLNGDQIAFRAYLNDATDAIFIASPTSSIIHYSVNNHWYGIFDTKKNWHSARSFCEALGGYLTTLTSNEENNFVYHHLAENYKNFWLGATDEVSEGDWQWVNVEDAWTYTNWAAGQPDDGYTGQDYLVFNPLFYPNVWDDNGLPNDNLELDFICEWNDLSDYANIIQKTDIDNDGTTDGLDLSNFIAAYGSYFGDPNYNPETDFDNDGDVDHLNLITFAYMFGRDDPTRNLSTVPVFNQCDYQDTFTNPKNGNSENACAGCVPTSFGMLFINNFNVHNGFNLEIPENEYEALVLDIAHYLIEDIQGGSVQVSPGSLPVKMSEYTMIIDADDTDGLYEQIEWTIEYPILTEKTNDECITFIRNKLLVGEPTLFGGQYISPSSNFGHASIIAGYVKFRGEEYFKVHDTMDTTPKWWRILKHQTITVGNDTYNDQIMLERENGDYRFYMVGRVSDVISMTVIQIPNI